MNNCHECVTCKSADKVLESFIAQLPLETSHHRVESQKLKCGFGLQGVCCRLCANGPCRITPNSPRGVCGANSDVIVVRNFLRAVAAGSGCYIHVVENTARNLKQTALAKGELRGLNTLERLCDLLGVTGADSYEKALNVAEAILTDIYRPDFEQMQLVQKIAYPPRYQNWQKLGILPGGAKSEVFSGLVKSSTNLNSDPVDMLVTCLRLGISTGLYGLLLTNLLNDVLLGEPKIRIAPVGLRVIDPAYINILITGHQHSLFAHLQNRLMQDDVTKRANEAGAKGFRLVGCTCVGQDLQLRGAHYEGLFEGHAGNNYASEAILATGAIDVVLSEFNCTLPGIEPICESLKIKQICLDSVAKKANAELKEFVFKERELITNEIINETLETYKTRRPEIALNLLAEHGNDNTLTGVSEGTLKEFLGGSWKPLVDLIASGQIKGVAAVVGCSNLVAGGYDVLTVELTKELIAKDILVLTAGCSSGGIENCNLMTLEAAEMAGPNLKSVCQSLGIPPVLNFGPCLAIGRLETVAVELAKVLNVDLPQLPLVLSAPQWLEEQALADGSFGLALGLPLHLGLPPFITGSKVAVKILTEDMKQLTGGQFIINSDAKESANILESIIIEKRKALNI
ncbi:MAG: anaerobic carbon-monoxide dehydrogenase catalytic subunit [Nitrososphaerota archaeon]|jgi:carbon-monoxide dehydrogenase catalytic subunit|nr:anaerobic carbon-monoxide dehydrogenase catalytic subunit [Nitrososphaerota archaeon]